MGKNYLPRVLYVVNVNPADNGNGILRAYFLPVLQPNLRRVLEIGLGSGSWASVISSYPEVESLRVVEINPKYLDALQQYPAIATSLGPKVSIVIDAMQTGPAIRTYNIMMGERRRVAAALIAVP